MNADDSLANARREAAKLEQEMTRLLADLSGLRGLEIVFPLDALELPVHPSPAVPVPTYAVRG